MKDLKISLRNIQIQNKFKSKLKISYSYYKNLISNKNHKMKKMRYMSNKAFNHPRHLLFIVEIQMKNHLIFMMNFTKMNTIIKFAVFKEKMVLLISSFLNKVLRIFLKWLIIIDLFVQQIIYAEENMDQQELK